MTDERLIAKAIEEAGRRIAVKLTKIENELAEMNARAEMNRRADISITEEEEKTLQALETCTGTDCGSCKYLGIEQCYDQLIRDARSLIRRLLAEKGVEI